MYGDKQRDACTDEAIAAAVATAPQQYLMCHNTGNDPPRFQRF